MVLGKPMEIGEIGVPKWCKDLAESAAPDPRDRVIGRHNQNAMMDKVRLQTVEFMRMDLERSLDLFECFSGEGHTGSEVKSLGGRVRQFDRPGGLTMGSSEKVYSPTPPSPPTHFPQTPPVAWPQTDRSKGSVWPKVPLWPVGPMFGTLSAPSPGAGLPVRTRARWRAPSSLSSAF
jgi:hypothetical protein